MANLDVSVVAETMELKVCQLCAVDFTLEHFLLPLIDRMQREGWNVTAVCSDGSRIENLRSRGYDIETVSIKRNLNIWSHFLSFLSLVRLFKKYRFDVVHVHTPIAALIGRFAARVAGVPIIIYTAHGFYFHDEMSTWKKRFFTYLEVFGGYCTDYLFTQSAEDAETARSEGLCKKQNIMAIGNGVNAERFNPSVFTNERENLRSCLGITKNSFVIGIVARMVQEKGICEFLNAACSAAGKNSELVFLMVGDRLLSDHAGYVSSMIDSARQVLSDRLIMTGARSDIPELLTVMDLFCLPSWREGMPRTILEAMMMAKPVIATNIRGSREEVVEGVTGFLVPTKDPKALEQAILKCAENRNCASLMGKAGRERALEHFNENQIVEVQIIKIKELLETLR